MSNKRILIIDDDPCIREVVHICLSEIGKYEVIEAGSGQEGLTEAFKEHPDAIVLDLCMPQMDGMEVLRQLRASQVTQMIPVILLSAQRSTMKSFAAAENSDRLSRQGIIETILKPFNCLTLPERIATACHWNSE